MYRYIVGNIVEQGVNFIVVDNNGIGYKIFVPNPYSYELNSNFKVYLYSHIREDEYSLYGFKSVDELDLFLKLINVKGLGPKVASNFFATGSIGGIIDAINRENILYLTKFPKVGEKLAKQIILDLKGKINLDLAANDDSSTEDLISVLESLGYKNGEIKKIIVNVDQTKPLEEQVKDALKLLLK
jgi:holliday junction DNA helicase RuvA